MIRSVRVILFFAVVLITGRTQAQVYPVQGNGVLIPPYSVYLSDYTSGVSDRLILNLVLNDITRPELQVRLRTKIIGQNVTLETKPEYIGKELVLQGGIPLRITGSELTEYFNPNNLNFSGISRREFDKTGALPAGFYQFCFEVLEYNRGVKISNSICANGWLILNDPPIINLPRNGEKLTPTQPQNIVFQWTPRHTGSPNSAFSTEYDIKVVELWPVNRNPNDAILTSPPILETTTRSTTFIYDVSQTPLEPGRHYALQVKAKSIVGADELDLFKNNGKSEVITFVYGDACNVPQNILAEASSATRFTVKWTGDFNHTGYSLRYRAADNPTAPWYTSTTLVPDAGVSALQPNTTYEFQVAGGCGVFESAYSGIGRIKTLDTSEQGYACGMPLEQFNLDPASLLDALKVGDVIQAGDFEVKISKVSGSGGTFSGEGVIEVPFFNKAKVKAEFSGIVVNKDMRMVSGYLNVTGAGVDVIPSGVLNLVDQLSETLSALDTALANIEDNLPKPFDEHAFVADTTLTLPGPVVVDKDENGNVIITDAQGVEHRLSKGTEVAVIDDQGNGTLIDSQGKAHSVSASVATAAANREYNLALKFTEAPASKYGFDAVTDKSPDALKSRYRDTVLDGKYYTPYKSIETGATDFVVGVLEGASIDRSKIRFETGGIPVPLTPFNGDESTITVSAKSDGEEQALIAVLPGATEKDKDQVLGRVNVVTYEQISKVLHIVPVNGNEYKFGTAESLQRELNRIYGEAIVNWSVTIESGIQVEAINPFDVGQTSLLTNYTDHMKKVISAYKTAASIQQDENNFYLFLVNTPNDPAVAGYMPRSKQFGFIFYDHHGNEPSITRTMAHELGHGAFNLHHTFMEENFSLPKNSTNNLMDYAGGTKLYKYQWDMMRSAPIVMGLFEGDGEAEYVSESATQQVARIINSIRCGLKKQNSEIEIHYGSYQYEVKLGDIVNLLDFEEHGNLSTEEFKNSKLLVRIGGYGNEGFFSGYKDIKLRLAQFDYKTEDRLIIPGDGGSLIFRFSYLSDAPTRQSVYKWLTSTLSKESSTASIFRVNNGKKWKADEILLFSECELEQLSRTNRKDLITELIDNQESFTLDKDTYQYLLINVLQSIPQNDKQYFYGELKKIPEKILSTYSVMATDQQRKLVAVLLEFWTLFESKERLITNSEIIISYSIFGNPSNQIWAIEGELIFFKNDGKHFPEIDMRTEPLDPISIGIKTEGGERKFVLVPALVVKYLADQGGREDLKDLGWTAVNIGLMAVGVGEVIQGFRAVTTAVKASEKFLAASFRFVLGTADLAASITSNYCGSTTNKDSEFCKTWAEYEFFVNLGLLSASSADLIFAKLKKAYKEAPNGFTSEQKNFLENQLGLFDKAAYPLGTAFNLIEKTQGDIFKFFNAAVNADYKIETVGSIVKVYSKNGVDVLAEISESSIRLKYSGWGGDIITKSDRTTTCIAKFNDQFDPPGSQFIKNEIPEGGFGRGTSNNGGVNILDVDRETYNNLRIEAEEKLKSIGKNFSNDDITREANEIFWDRYNLPYLEKAFERGDDIRLLSDPTTLFGNTGFYQREIEAITLGWKRSDGTAVEALSKKYNYSYNSSTKTYEKIR